MAYLRPVRHLVHNLVDGVEKRRSAIEHQPIGIGNMLQRLLVNTVLTTYGEVHAAIGILLSGYNIGRNIAREGSTGLHHRTSADTRPGIFNDRTGEDDAVLNLTIAGNLRTIAEDAAVADLRVVRDVGPLHQHVLVADDGLSAGVGGTVDDHIFADNVTIADNTLRLLATELEVLRQSTDDTALVHLVTLSHARTITYTDKGEDDTAVANHHVVLDIREREYLTVVAYFRLWADFGLWGYFTCHISILLCTAAERLIQVDYGLHLIELVGNFANLSIQQVTLGRDDF